MPTSLTLDLPILLRCHGGLHLAEPVGFPEYAFLAATPEDAVAVTLRRLQSVIKRFMPGELVMSLVRGEVTLSTLDVEFKPEPGQSHWQQAWTIPLDVLRYRVESAVEIAVVPALQIRIAASVKTDVDRLVAQQVRATIRRSRESLLATLTTLHESAGSTLVSRQLTVKLPTPSERARWDAKDSSSGRPTLSKVAVRIDPNSIRPASHRDGEVKQLGDILSMGAANGRRGGSALLVGPTGVGKTAIFQTWMRSVTPPPIVYATDGSRLISGESGFGGWQQQCLRLIDEARRDQVLLHLGNAVELCQSGRAWGSGGVGSLLAPRIADGTIQVVIECLPAELATLQRTEPHLVEALTPLHVTPPDPATTRDILLDAAANWCPVDITETLRQKNRKRKRKANRRAGFTLPSRAPKVVSRSVTPSVEPDALLLLDRLHRRFPTVGASPGRALHSLDAMLSELVGESTNRSVGESASQSPIERTEFPETIPHPGKGPVLDVARVIEGFSRQTGLPRFLIDTGSPPDLDAIGKELSSQVLGQEAAIDRLVDLIAVLSTDLSRGDRPLASLLLIGPTGVGKTETAKALARLFYGDVSRLVRIDMAEYADPIAAMRLIGTVSQPDGVLTSAVQAQPFSLILLDEFEKADHSVFDLLLQVMGEGRLTDRAGRVADFRNSILLMTSNLGVEDYRANAMGLAAMASATADTIANASRLESHFRRRVSEFLRPEMLNRIDRIIAYQPLSPETIHQLTRSQIDDLRRRDGLREHSGELTVDAAVVASISESAYQPQFGARPLQREIQDRLLVPLSAVVQKAVVQKAVVQKSRRNGQDIHIEFVADQVHVHRKALSKTPKHKRDLDNSVQELVSRASLLRRRSQSLQQCDPFMEVRNRHEWLTRTIKHQLAATTKPEKRRRIRFGENALERQTLATTIARCRRVVRDVEKFEALLLERTHNLQPIDVERATRRADVLEDRLFTTLTQLSHSKSNNHDRITLVVSGPNLAIATPLLLAYQKWASSSDRSMEAHVLIRRGRNGESDPVVESEGWQDKPAFRLASQSSSSQLPENKDFRSHGLAAFAMRSGHFGKRQDALKNLPDGTLAVMLTFRGPGVSGLIAGEAGVHSFNLNGFRPSRANHDATSSVMVELHATLPIDYVAPDWLIQADFQYNGYPRRNYDLSNDMVQELKMVDVGFTYSSMPAQTSKLDRSGRWLEDVLESHHRATMWAILDQGWPSDEFGAPF
ncbi:AAA family ATPase [Neorhodopirellula pilleata]|uniref:ATP-dependent Clp protease ATP-binding subunit ClpC n=1 Tax=Neorhodopirellula pilleata TaxID=2714738 RepID=A0A5C6AUE5_9BACT|nr:AAA family ATPase [Neorhodopirellula pilleata]TWU03615.1 ATP-dependent Clp protease ATP-binding subunit ClpC [Neorhodopirellula pilleata]